jgi:hypothetical protein
VAVARAGADSVGLGGSVGVARAVGTGTTAIPITALRLLGLSRATIPTTTNITAAHNALRAAMRERSSMMSSLLPDIDEST